MARGFLAILCAAELSEVLAVGAIKCTLLFANNLGAGWTASLWQPESTDPNRLTNAAEASARLAQKWAPMLGKGTSIVGSRVSEEGVFRDGYTSTVAPFYPLKGYQQAESDNPWQALLCRVHDLAKAKWKNIFLRGIWDAAVLGGEYNPNISFNNGTTFQARMDQMGAQLVTDGWGWLGSGARQQQNVTAVVQNSDGTVTITLAAGITGLDFTKKYQMRFSGLQGAIALNGQLLIAPTSATSMRTVRRVSIFPWTTGGICSYTPRNVFIVIDPTPYAIQVKRPTERKSGRAFFVLRGRRLAKGAS
jgi:hypothetical protein